MQVKVLYVICKYSMRQIKLHFLSIMVELVEYHYLRKCYFEQYSLKVTLKENVQYIIQFCIRCMTS